MPEQVEELDIEEQYFEQVIRGISERLLSQPESLPSDNAAHLKQGDVSRDRFQRIAEAFHEGDSAFSTLGQEVTSPRTQEEAVSRLQGILDQRRRVPVAGEQYIIPYEELDFSRGKMWAMAPSLVDDDRPVRVKYYERKKKGDRVVQIRAYDKGGSKAGEHMPLVSDARYKEMCACLKMLPGYTEICEETGQRFNQPLKRIASRLLRGQITIQQIVFDRVAPSVQLAKRADETIDSSATETLQLSLIDDMANHLVSAGLDDAKSEEILRVLWSEAPSRDIAAALELARRAMQEDS